MMTETKIKSTHGAMKALIAVLATMGLALGRMIFQKIVCRVAPSSVAASSSERGSVSKKPLAI